jgi:hypothetical protein
VALPLGAQILIVIVSQMFSVRRVTEKSIAAGSNMGIFSAKV